MAETKVTESDVLYVADLANLELTAEEKGRMVRDLNSILEHVEMLNELDTSNVPPLAEVVSMFAGTQLPPGERFGYAMRADEAASRAAARGRAGQLSGTDKTLFQGSQGHREIRRSRSHTDLLTIDSARELVARKQTSATALAEAFYSRIAAEDEKIGAFLTLCRERALAKAAEIDRLAERGDPLPPLAGVPVAMKDVLMTRGVRTTAASKILDNFIAPYDCTAVARMEAAGAVVLGKLNCDEFAMGSSNENSGYKPVHNPRDLTRVPGGSSGGSAAAVAAGMAVAALGSDTGGSIRQPAAFCGVVGLLPTYGRVSRYGLIAFGSSLDHIGPLTKTVKDAAIDSAESSPGAIRWTRPPPTCPSPITWAKSAGQSKA